ncbi:MAG: hypothetical protein JXR10_10250 [Cyclobacteriaceae bacterium]
MKWNLTIAVLFGVLTIAFITLSMTNPCFFHWVFDRHHNTWSWYIRPLFLIPFCYYAFRRNWAGISITIFCLFTSMFWFPRPDVVDQSVREFLHFEKNYLLGSWDAQKVLLSLTIPLSFLALGASFWKRSILMGLGVVILMATGKVIWSIQNAGESGQSIILPAIVGLLICCTLIFFGFRRLNNK